MVGFLNSYLSDGFANLIKAGGELLWPALFFLALGLIVKRGQFFTDAKRAAHEASLNVQIVAFNAILVAPALIFGSQAVVEIIYGANLFAIQPSFWSGVPAWLTILVAIFIGDFIGYWRHRLEHTRILWPSHAVHHSDTEMTWIAVHRFHPINRVTTFFIDSSILLMLGLPPFALIANNLVRHYYGAFIHADLPWTYGPLSRIFVSPAMHRWHHAKDAEAFDTNYATVFSIFDRAFGTYRVPGPCDVPLGVTDDMVASLYGQMAHPFKPSSYQNWVSVDEHIEREKADAAKVTPAE